MKELVVAIKAEPVLPAASWFLPHRLVQDSGLQRQRPFFNDTRIRAMQADGKTSSRGVRQMRRDLVNLVIRISAVLSVSHREQRRSKPALFNRAQHLRYILS